MYRTGDKLFFPERALHIVNFHLAKAGRKEIAVATERKIASLIKEGFISLKDSIEELNLGKLTLYSSEDAVPGGLVNLLMSNPEMSKKELKRKIANDKAVDRIKEIYGGPKFAWKKQTKSLDELIYRLSHTPEIDEEASAAAEQAPCLSMIRLYGASVEKTLGRLTKKNCIENQLSPGKLFNEAVLNIKDKDKNKKHMLIQYLGPDGIYKRQSLVENEEGLALALSGQKNIKFEGHDIYTDTFSAKVPSRSTGELHKVVLQSVPIIYSLDEKDTVNFYLWRNFKADTDVESAEFSQARSRLRKKRSERERIFLPAQAVALYYLLAKGLWKKDYRIEISPFALPTKELSEITDFYRYSAIIQEGPDDKPRFRPLNKIEREIAVTSYAKKNPGSVFFRFTPAHKPSKYILKEA